MEELMVKHVNYGLRKKMSMQLDPELVSGHNWKMLAEKLGYTYQDIMALEAKQTAHGSNTQKLLDDYGLRGDSTLQNLFNQLEAIDRHDTVELLEDALPDIRKAYEEDQQSPMWSSSSTSRTTHCHFGPALPPYSRHYSHPCPSGFHQCPQADHCYLSGPCAWGQHPHSSLSAASHPSRTRSSCSDASPSSNASRHLCNCHRLRTHGQQAHGQQAHGQRLDFGQQTTAKIQNHTHHRQPRPQYQHNISIEDNNLVSMEVCHANTHIKEREQDFAELSSCSLTTDAPEGPRERPVPVEEGILRGMAYPPDTIPSIMRPKDMEVAAEEEVFTSGDSSSSSHSGKEPTFENPSQLVGKKQYQQQQEQLRRAQAASRKLNGRDRNRGKLPPGVEVVADRDRNGHAAHHVPGLKGPPSDQSKRSSFHSMKQSAGVGGGSAGQHGGSSEQQYGHSACSRACSRSRNCSGAARGSVPLDHSQQAPEAGMHGTASAHGNGNHSSSHFSQSPAHHYPNNSPVLAHPVVSVPKSSHSGKVKLAEVCKGSRKVKVFVTYASHRRWVENLSECLVANGFSSYLDINEQNQPMEELIKWYDYHFQTADFVLLCASARYKEEIEGRSQRAGQDFDNPLQDPSPDSIHTTYIYKLMQGEFLRNNSCNKRFVPVLFKGTSLDDVPNWLHNTLVYQWPSQYQDLLWMLTRPQDRVCSNMRRHNNNNNNTSPQ